MNPISLTSSTCLMLCLTAAAAAADEQLEQALSLLDALDRASVTAHYESERLVDVIADLGTRLPMPLRLDEDALRRIGVTETDRVSLHLPQSTASSALSALATALGDQFDVPIYEVHAGQVVLTSTGGAALMALTDVYDVRDLLVDEHPVSMLRQADEEAGPPRTDGAELMLLICDHVDPDAWFELGGNRATISERDGVMLLTAPPTTHRKFRTVLQQLRRAFPTEVALDVAIIEIDVADHDQVTRRYDPGSVGLMPALRAAAGRTLWETSAIDAVGEPCRIESTVEGVAVELELRPELERETGQLRIGVTLATESGDDRRSLQTTTVLSTGRGGAVLEIPAAEPGETRRLLLLARRR